MSRLRLVIAAGVVLTMLVGFFPATVGAAPAAQDQMGRVRFIHASFDAPGLDGLVDGTVVAAGLRGNSEYQDIAAGQHTFSWRAAGGAEDLAAVSVDITAGQRVTIVALGTFAALETRAYVDDVTAPARNRARIKVVHAVPDGGPVNVTMDDMTLATALAFGESSAVSQMYAGYHDIVVTGEDGTPIVSEAQKPINEDRTYLVLVVGTVASGAYRLLVYESSVLEPASNSNFMFANFAQGLTGVNVHINKEPAPLYSGVTFSSVQHPYAAGLGPYLIELYQPGSGPDSGTPLASGMFEIGANQTVLFVAQGSVEDISVESYVADLSPVPPQSSRLTVINTAVGNPPFAVEKMEGGTLIDSLDVFETASVIVPAGSYNLRFKDAASGAMMMEQGGIQVPDGTVTMLLAFDDDPVDPLINAVAVSSARVLQYAAVRWANLNIFGPPADIYMDGVPVVTSLVYKMKTDYQLYEPKVYTLTVYPVGSDPAAVQPLDTLQIELAGENFPRTIFLYGQPDQAKFSVAPDSLEMIPAGMARIRFINAAIDATGVAVYNSTDGSLVVDNIPFGQASFNSNVAAGTYSFNFVAGFGPVTNIQGMTIEEGKIYTVVLGGIVTESPGAEVFVFETTP